LSLGGIDFADPTCEIDSFFSTTILSLWMTNFELYIGGQRTGAVSCVRWRGFSPDAAARHKGYLSAPKPGGGAFGTDKRGQRVVSQNLRTKIVFLEKCTDKVFVCISLFFLDFAIFRTSVQCFVFWDFGAKKLPRKKMKVSLTWSWPCGARQLGPKAASSLRAQ